MRLRIVADPHDLWVGIYWRKSRQHNRWATTLDVYILPIPMLGFKLSWTWSWGAHAPSPLGPRLTKRWRRQQNAKPPKAGHRWA